MAIPRQRIHLPPRSWRRALAGWRRGELWEGEPLARFERAIAGEVGVAEAISVPSGRIALRFLLEALDLTSIRDRRIHQLSGGQRRRLDLALGLVGDPELLFLDEPTTGLDPRSRVELWDEIRGLADGGAAVVLTTQYLEEADRLSDRIVIIDEGVVAATGTSGELKDDLERDVFEVHLQASTDLEAAVVTLEGLAVDVATDPEQSELQIPLADGAGQSLDILRRLDAAGIEIADFQLRKPTLDDVFLTLTTTGVEQ